MLRPRAARARPTRLRAVALLTAAATCAACTGDDGDDAPALPEELRSERVVFTREHGIYAAAADGSGLRKLIDLPRVFEFQPDVSPDGTQIALRVDDEGPSVGTWLVDADGGTPFHLSKRAGVPGGAADWSPTGDELAYAGKRSSERFFGIYVVSRDGSRARRLTPDRWEAQYPAWSPDGSRIAFTRVVPATNSFDIYVVRPDGSRLERITSSPAADNYAAWSPDGEQLVFSSDERGGLWIVNADGTGERFLTAGGEPQWEPNEWIVFDCPASSGPGRACVVRPDGSGRAVLPLGEAAFPNWFG